MISTNPLIIRIIVSLHRKGHGQSKLKEIVGPLIEEVYLNALFIVIIELFPSIWKYLEMIS